MLAVWSGSGAGTALSLTRRDLAAGPPRPDYPVADLSEEPVERRTVLGGLISEYKRAA
jgi:hypothetical protein